MNAVYRYSPVVLKRYADDHRLETMNFPSSVPLTEREAEIPGFPARQKCANPNCEYLAHQDTHMFGNFCCLRCSQPGKRKRKANNRDKHGVHCERLLHERVLLASVSRPNPETVHLADNGGKDYDDLHYNVAWDNTRRCSNPKCPYIRHRNPNAPIWLGTFCCLMGFESRCKRHGPECTNTLAPPDTMYDYYVVRPSYGIKNKELEKSQASSSYNPAPVMRREDGSEGVWDESSYDSSSPEVQEPSTRSRPRIKAKAKPMSSTPPTPPPPRHRARPLSAPPVIPRGSAGASMSDTTLTRRLREAAEVNRAISEFD